MNIVNVIVKNTSFLIIGDVLHKLVMILFISVLARELGPELFGNFTLALVLAGLVISLTDPGVSQIIYREVATGIDSSSFIGAGAVLRFAFLPIGFGCLMLLAYLLGYPQDVLNIIAVVGLGVLVLGATEFYFLIFKATGKAYLFLLTQIFLSVLVLIVVLILVTLHLNIIQVSWIYLAQSILTMIIVILIVTIAGFRHQMPSMEKIVTVLRRGFPLGLQSFMILIYLYADTVMLSFMRTMESVGYYQAAYRMVTSLNIVGTASVASVFPYFVQQHVNRGSKLMEAYYRTSKYLLTLGFGIAMGTTMLAEKIIVLFFGTGFSSSIRILQILIWSEALIFLSFVCAGLLLAQDRRWVLFKQAILAAVLNIGMNLPAIYYWGAVGSAVTTVATEVFALIYLTYQIHQSGIHLEQRWLSDVGRVAIACIVMSIVLLMSKSLPLVLLIVIGGSIYIGTLLLLRFFDEVDLHLGRQVFNIARQKASGISF